MKMIEKVARAIDSNYPHGLNCSVPNCPACTEANKDTEAEAKAAIEAMLEPTEEMIDAGGNEALKNLGADEALGNEGTKDVFQAMIAEALKE